jgi:hypothetical protein
MGNDGRARILVALEPRSPDDHQISTRSSPARKAVDPALLTALEAHVASLKTENERLAETFKAELGTPRRRDRDAQRPATASEARVTAADARAADEAARTAEAIAAFKSLGQRLEAIVEARRPLWHRLLWRA